MTSSDFLSWLISEFNISLPLSLSLFLYTSVYYSCCFYSSDFLSKEFDFFLSPSNQLALSLALYPFTLSQTRVNSLTPSLWPLGLSRTFFENANEEKGGLLREPAERLSKAIQLPSDHEQWSRRCLAHSLPQTFFTRAMIHYENRSRCTNQFEQIDSSHLELSFSASTWALLCLLYYYDMKSIYTSASSINFDSYIVCISDLR